MKVRLLGTPTSCGFTYGAEYKVKDFDIKTGNNELCDGAWIDNEPSSTTKRTLANCLK
jgi:hypothetical protein